MAELTVPQINFGSLADLPQVYRNARSQATRDQILSSSDPNNLSLADLTNRLLVGGDLEGAKNVAAIQQAQSSGNSVYGTPIYGTVNGQTAIGTFDKRGQFRPINTGSFQPTPGVKTIEGPTGTYVVNSRSGAPVGATAQQPGVAPQGGAAPGYYPKDVAGAAQQHEEGQAAGKASFSLPNTLSTIDQSIGVIDKLINHPGRAAATGLSSRLDPRNYIPATDATNFQVALRQLEGQTFLQQYNELRGSGAITEAEGQKATQAKARLDRAQSDDEFLQALTDLRDILVVGRQRATQMARQRTMQPQSQAARPPIPNARQAPDGNWYVPDPNRPGKFLQVK